MAYLREYPNGMSQSLLELIIEGTVSLTEVGMRSVFESCRLLQRFSLKRWDRNYPNYTNKNSALVRAAEVCPPTLNELVITDCTDIEQWSGADTYFAMQAFLKTPVNQLHGQDPDLEEIVRRRGPLATCVNGVRRVITGVRRGEDTIGRSLDGTFSCEEDPDCAGAHVLYLLAM